MKFFSGKYFKFSIAAVIYLLWVIWIGSFWLLVGLPIIFDIYVTKKVNWSFWKRREGKNHVVVEWIDALIFAVVAVTLINIFLFQNYRIPTGSMEKSLLIGDHLFVSKVAYGPRIPNTPIAFPFTQHTMPVTNGKSWSNLVQWPYKRLKGFREIERYDPVVFNFPEGDTVVLEDQAASYYEIVRAHARNLRARDIMAGREAGNDDHYHRLARKDVITNSSIVYRPVDRRDNYVKRCVALPGDTLLIREGVVIINGIPEEDNGNLQTTYYITTNGTPINPRALERLNIYRTDQRLMAPTLYMMPLTAENAEAISRFANVTDVSKVPSEISWAPNIFPHNSQFVWNQDHFGPLWIPARGATIELTPENVILYRRVIDVYEDNEMLIDGDDVYINGELAGEYTFKMDYYWLMGDNRHQSSDSRFWGFVPEDHIVGSPRFIWLSLNKEAGGLKKIRFNRFFARAR